ncbi:AsnC/Lrp family transcriptional regulator [Pedobacter cryoconitis]|uniref:AsnC/Lrp family transcriptional regulator n=1 Tax=Pedobacter cryoconitis TaxID=188932 RepID=A0A127V7U4_9SPHI|nr:Lrp/AsnC family transcriptional regulator [Pedobacter cryoconitis]AMP97366.1 AsnC/Lrp family transcriptional regulator [Pedobacter cryoconitis]
MNSHLDPTDLGILNLLQENGRLTNKELAHQLNRTISPIFDRRKRLEEMGYIKKYVAILDREKITTSLVAFPQIALTSHSEDALASFQKTVISYPEVLECYHITGKYDFMLKIIIPDMHAYNAFLRQKIAPLENVGNVHSSLVISQAKSEIGLPL